MIEKFLVRVKYGSWNRWRDEHPDDAINLDGVNLDGMILTGINSREQVCAVRCTRPK